MRERVPRKDQNRQCVFPSSASGTSRGGPKGKRSGLAREGVRFEEDKRVGLAGGGGERQAKRRKSVKDPKRDAKISSHGSGNALEVLFSGGGTKVERWKTVDGDGAFRAKKRPTGN